MYADKHIHWKDEMTTIDKAIRTGLAVALVGQLLFITGSMDWQAYFMVIGVYFATTAICGWDPIYSLFTQHRKKPVVKAKSTTIEHIHGVAKSASLNAKLKTKKAANDSQRDKRDPGKVA